MKLMCRRGEAVVLKVRVSTVLLAQARRAARSDQLASPALAVI